MGLRSLHASVYSGGSFGPTLSVAGGNGFLDTAILSSGDLVVAYFNVDRVSSRRFSPSAPAGQEWGAEETVDIGHAGAPELLVDAQDKLTALWVSGQIVRAARYEGGAWQPATDLGFTDHGPAMALDRDGNVSVVYGSNTGPLKLRRLAATGGAWTDAVDAANETGTAQAPMVAHDAAGNVIVAYALGRVLPQGGTDSHIRWVVCE